MTAANDRRRRGAPRRPHKRATHGPHERRAAILEAASEVFFEAGYEGASIDAIIERVGGSKRTLYNEFGSKEGLFTELMKANVRQAIAALAPEELTGHDLRSTLMSFGQRLMSVQMRPSVLALYRAIVHEGPRFPELARRFWDNGPGRVSAHLAVALATYRERGEIEVADCARAADVFVGMIRGNPHLQVVLGLCPPPDPEEAATIVATQVEIFLNGVRTRR